MERLNNQEHGKTQEKGRKSFRKPTLHAYEKGSFRGRTAQVSQRGINTSPVKPMGLQLGGS